MHGEGVLCLSKYGAIKICQITICQIYDLLNDFFTEFMIYISKDIFLPKIYYSSNDFFNESFKLQSSRFKPVKL